MLSIAQFRCWLVAPDPDIILACLAIRTFYTGQALPMSTDRVEFRNLSSASRAGRWSCWLVVLIVAFLIGCTNDNALIVYTALDSEFSEPLLQQFSKETGVAVRPRFDTESNKTVVLTQAIISEAGAGNVRCDLFWNNEILNTLRLKQRGLLDVYLSPSHTPYSERFRGSDNTWHGFAARTRVLIVNTTRVPEDQRPTSILDLTDPKWKGQVGIGKPLAGTTATHAACLFAKWGDAKAKKFFDDLRKNEVAIESGNKQVALRVASGQLAIGLTDTDDAIMEKEKGLPIEIIFPDSAPDQLGTLVIPNTLAVIKGCRHRAEARRLIDYLLSEQVEQQLAAGPSAQIPLNPNVEAADLDARLTRPSDFHAMEVDFELAAEKWDTTAQYLRSHFLAP